MCVYMHVCVVCMCVYICVYMCMCVCACMRTCMYVCVYICVCVCVCVCVHQCVYMCSFGTQLWEVVYMFQINRYMYNIYYITKSKTSNIEF